MDDFDPDLVSLPVLASFDEVEGALGLNCDSGEMHLSESLDPDIDWDAVIVSMNPKEEETNPPYSQIKKLQQRSANMTTPRISDSQLDFFTTTDSSLEFASKRKHEPDEDEDDVDKIMRIGSLGRIIASSNAADIDFDQFYAGDETETTEPFAPPTTNISIPMVQERKFANGSASPAAAQSSATQRKRVTHRQLPGMPAGTGPPPLKGAVAFGKIVEAFNMGDLESLSNLIKTQCHCDCELHTKSVRHVIRGRKEVMMFWALQMETYPDGIWTCTKSSAKAMTISREYKFSGTRMFRRNTNDLFHSVQLQVAEYHELTKASIDIDEISAILENCWVSPTTSGRGYGSAKAKAGASSSAAKDPHHTRPVSVGKGARGGSSASSNDAHAGNIPIKIESESTASGICPPLPQTMSREQFAAAVINSNISESTDSHASDVSHYSANSSLSSISALTHISDSSNRDNSGHLNINNSSNSTVISSASANSILTRPIVSIKSTNVMTKAIRQEGRLENIDRQLMFTFNFNHYIVRIDCVGDF